MASDFDPEAFAAGDFDPEAFAAEPSRPETPDETALRESFLSKKNFRPSPAHRKFANTGPIEQVRSELDPSQLQGPDLPQAIAAAGNSALDRYSLGAYGGLLRLGAKLGVPSTGQAIGDVEQYRQQAPIAASASDAPAYLVEGPANMLFQAADRAVGRALSSGGEQAAQSLGGRFLRSTGTAGLGSAGTAGLQAVSEGADPAEALQAAKRGGEAGLETGAILGAGAAGAGELGKLVQESKGGRARQFIESRGGTVGPRGVNLEGDYAATGATDADIGEQAAASARKGLNMLNEQDRSVKGALGTSYERTGASPEAAQLRDVTGLVTRLQDAVDSVGIDPGVRSALRDELATIAKKQGADFNPEVDNYFLTEADVNSLKRGLDRYAKTGISSAEKLHPLKQAADETRGMVNEGPFREVNAQYSAQAKRNQLDRRLLRIPERPTGVNGLADEEGVISSGESGSAEDVVKNRIMRRGQNTVTAGGQRTDLERFARRHPDIAAEFEKPELLRRRADISFHLAPKHGGLIERVGPAAHGVLPAIAAFAHSPGAALGALGTTITLQNLPAIQARLLYGPALAAQAAAPMMLGEVPLLAAARAAQTENR